MNISILKFGKTYNSTVLIFLSKLNVKKFNFKRNILNCQIDTCMQRHYGSKKSTKGLVSSLKTHNCGELDSKDAGKEVRLRGFLQYQRMGKFCILRDSFGLTQVFMEDKEMSSLLQETFYESYIEVIGEVKLRSEAQINKELSTGKIEVVAKKFEVLNAAKEVPFLIRSQNIPIEQLAMKYRYLSLRQKYLQDNLRFRSKLSKRMRDYLQDTEEFVEITTPSLSVNTPGGAQEFVVPSQLKGRFYSLVQSPQTYKQLLVIGGFERYFQFALCYRDEGGKPDRQPEFMQLDLEMSDTTIPEIKVLMETLILKSWPEDYPPLSVPFSSMTYDQAMDEYGTDKPDTRFEWKLCDVTDILSQSDAQIFTDNLKGIGNVAKAFVIPNGGECIKNSYQKDWDMIAEKEVGLRGVILLHIKDNNTLKGPAAKAFSKPMSDSLIGRLNCQKGDVIVLSLGHRSKVLKLLGKLRILGADILDLSSESTLRDPQKFNFLWVDEFPLFEMDSETEKLVSCHHPFTAPVPDDTQLLYENPLQVRSQHYDLVLNGTEIAGGSIRIHNPSLQRDVLDILNIDSASLNFLLEALSYGAPPHGGIALGFDRYISILRGCKTVREVMAFPKTSEGKCLMSGAPEETSQLNKKLYHLT